MNIEVFDHEALRRRLVKLCREHGHSGVFLHDMIANFHAAVKSDAGGVDSDEHHEASISFYNSPGTLVEIALLTYGLTMVDRNPQWAAQAFQYAGLYALAERELDDVELAKELENVGDFGS